MKFTLTFTLAAAVASIAPVIATPAECSQSYDGSFQITAVKPSAKRSLTKRNSTCNKEGYLTLTLHDGQLIDSKGRAGYIASNYQFQFDQPPQENADSVGGYSACNNGSLALGSSTIFYQCLSGNFYNLYDRHWAAQCQPTYIDILPCNDDPSSSRDPVSQIGDGQPQASSATTRVPVSQIPDGQPQAPTATARAPITQISDGQPQAPVATEPAYSPPATYTQPAITGSPITQISDGQPQAPPATFRTSPVASASNPKPNSVQTANPSAPITAGSNLNKASSFGAFIIAATAAAFFLQ